MDGALRWNEDLAGRFLDVPLVGEVELGGESPLLIGGILVTWFHCQHASLLAACETGGATELLDLLVVSERPLVAIIGTTPCRQLQGTVFAQTKAIVFVFELAGLVNVILLLYHQLIVAVYEDKCFILGTYVEAFSHVIAFDLAVIHG